MSIINFLENHKKWTETLNRGNRVFYNFKEEEFTYQVVDFIGKSEGEGLEDGPRWCVYKGDTIFMNKTIWQTPLWFRQLFKEMTDHYYKINRVRMLTKNKRRTLWSLSEQVTLFQLKGEEIYSCFDEDDYYVDLLHVDPEKVNESLELFRLLKEIDDEIYFYEIEDEFGDIHYFISRLSEEETKEIYL